MQSNHPDPFLAGAANPTDTPQQELVSIITPAYKAHSVIQRAVQSVISQTYPHWEMLIVSDDGCDYQDLLKQSAIHDPRLRFLKSDKIQSGPNVTRNIALAHAKGRYIAPLDADDLYYPPRLEKLLPAAKSHGTTARRDGEDYVLDGHKIWTSYSDCFSRKRCSTLVGFTRLCPNQYPVDLRFPQGCHQTQLGRKYSFRCRYDFQSSRHGSLRPRAALPAGIA